MKLFTKAQALELAANGRRSEAASIEGDLFDPPPVVKLFNPVGAGTWLISESDTQDPDILFGLCDLGVGCPELGSVRASELSSYRGPLGLGIERDRHFCPEHALSWYADQARDKGHITV